MRQKRTFVTLVLVVAVLFLGIVYASVLDLDLTIDGTATATSDQANFQVRFLENTEDVKTNITTTKTEKDTIIVSATIEDELTANISCSGLTAKGDYVTATYTIENASPQLKAYLTAEVASDNDAFTVTQSWGESVEELEAEGDTTTLTVTVTLNETITTEDGIVEDVTIKLLATPDAPTVAE